MENLLFERFNGGRNTKRAIIGVHGWGGNRFSFKQIAISLNIPDAEWFFPEAPYMLENNQEKRSWSYEIEPGVWEREKPKKLLDNFISNQVLSKHDSKNVFFVGFSQGGLICYEYALTSPHSWAGVFPIAGFMIDPTNEGVNRLHPNQKQTPILIGHGINDSVVKLESSQIAYALLKSQGAKVEFIKYNGNHKISIEFLRKMKEKIISTPVFP